MTNVINKVIETIFYDGDGEIFAEDVNGIMNGLGLGPELYRKVETTLENIAYNRKVAYALRGDARAAYDKYIGEVGYGPLDTATVESLIERYDVEAENGVKFLAGLGSAFGK